MYVWANVCRLETTHGGIMIPILLALTPTDYTHLATAVQMEAAPNTLDEQCVATSILNRVASPLYPNTVEQVIYSPGQYEGLQYRKFIPKPSAKVVLRLKDQEKMRQAYDIIGDRTDFKGQSMIAYRVEKEDPMCHPQGNFFHYDWQK